MSSLSDRIKTVTERARKYRDQRLGEQNTKASLIEPVLEALGWDIRDPDEVHREFRPTGRDNPVDYALKLLRKPRLFVEAKGLGETLADRRWVGQVLGYATVAGVEWCVLTDGDEYRFYNATAALDADEKMFWRMRLTETSEHEVERALSLISRQNLEQNLLDALWVSHYVDRRVQAALQQMIAGPDDSIIRRVRQLVPKLTKKVVTESIRRLDISVESPPVLPGATVTESGAPAPDGQPRPAKRRRSVPATRVTLADITRSGLVQTPLRLSCRYKGNHLEATLLPSGEVRFQGTVYATCSAAAEAARATVTGRKMNTNGWTFWRFVDASGEQCDLDALRRQVADPGEDEQPKLRLADR